eukprot:Pgem_evm1s11130
MFNTIVATTLIAAVSANASPSYCEYVDSSALQHVPDCKDYTGPHKTYTGSQNDVCEKIEPSSIKYVSYCNGWSGVHKADTSYCQNVPAEARKHDPNCNGNDSNKVAVSMALLTVSV